MAFLVGLSGFSDEAYKRAMGSELPLGLVHLPFRFGQDAREGEEAVSLSLNMAMRRILGEEFELAVKRGLEDGRTGVVLRWSGEGLRESSSLLRRLASRVGTFADLCSLFQMVVK